MHLSFGRYKILGAIASGGMAKVHLAKAAGVAGFERLVAVKRMHDHLAGDPEFVGMFLDEARLAARIRHPNVVATIDAQRSDSGLFLVMDYIEGPSLHAVIRKLDADGSRLDLGIALRIFLDVLAGLQAAHDLRGDDGAPLELVHRDVSPPNILVGTDGVARITDFGVARARSRLASTQGNKLKGKLAYMPPEQLMGGRVDRRSDVYAAGIVLWELLTGKRLFEADSEGALVRLVIEGASTAPCRIDPDVPEAIGRACMRALEFDRSKRYASAATFAEHLEAAAAEAAVGIASPRRVAAFIR